MMGLHRAIAKALLALMPRVEDAVRNLRLFGVSEEVIDEAIKEIADRKTGSTIEELAPLYIETASLIRMHEAGLRQEVERRIGGLKDEELDALSILSLWLVDSLFNHPFSPNAHLAIDDGEKAVQSIAVSLGLDAEKARSYALELPARIGIAFPYPGRTGVEYLVLNPVVQMIERLAERGIEVLRARGVEKALESLDVEVLSALTCKTFDLDVGFWMKIHGFKPEEALVKCPEPLCRDGMINHAARRFIARRAFEYARLVCGKFASYAREMKANIDAVVMPREGEFLCRFIASYGDLQFVIHFDPLGLIRPKGPGLIAYITPCPIRPKSIASLDACFDLEAERLEVIDDETDGELTEALGKREKHYVIGEIIRALSGVCKSMTQEKNVIVCDLGQVEAVFYIVQGRLVVDIVRTALGILKRFGGIKSIVCEEAEEDAKRIASLLGLVVLESGGMGYEAIIRKFIDEISSYIGR